MSGVELSELAPEPASGRVFERTMRPGIADVTGSGRARLDAIAGWIQDVAYLDSVDAGFEGYGAWIVRRLRIRAERFPHFGEDLAVRTFCAGIGRFCADRRTSIRGESARVEAVGLWICLDPESLRPTRFTPEFVDAYSESAAGRVANVRLRHPDPPDGAERDGAWTFRATDLDGADHVNNSHYWGRSSATSPVGRSRRRSTPRSSTGSRASPGRSRSCATAGCRGWRAPEGSCTPPSSIRLVSSTALVFSGSASIQGPGNDGSQGFPSPLRTRVPKTSTGIDSERSRQDGGSFAFATPIARALSVVRPARAPDPPPAAAPP